MASENTVTPDRSTNEQVEKKVNDDIKAVEQDVVSPSVENGGADVDEKLKTAELASSEAPIIESEEKMEDKLVDPPQVVPVEKVADVPVLDLRAVDVEKVIEDCHLEQDVSAVSVPAIEAVKKEPEEESKLSDAAVVPIEAVEEVDVVLPTPELEVPQSDYKTIETPELVADVAEKTHERPEVIKEVEEKSKVVEPKESTKSEIAKHEDKLQEDTESSKEEQISKDKVPVASDSCDIVSTTHQEGASEPKDGEVSAIPDVVRTSNIDVERVEEVKQPETPKAEDVVVGLATEAALDVGEIKEQKEENNVKVEENLEEKNVQVGNVSDVVEGLATEAALDVREVEEQKEEKNVKVEEDIEEKNVKVDEVKQPETTKTGDMSDSNAVTELTEESFEGKKASRDVEVVPEKENEECVKDDVDNPVETIKDGDTMDVVESTTSTVNEPIGKPKELVLEKKAKDTHETIANKLEVLEEKAKDAQETVANKLEELDEKAKDTQTFPNKLEVLEEKAKDTRETVANKLEKAAEVVEEIAKPDTPNLESSKDVTDTKPEGDMPKQEAPAKATQKQSNNIMSKVKQSIVKVKKAIIGKSPSSKTISSNAKDNLK